MMTQLEVRSILGDSTSFADEVMRIMSHQLVSDVLRAMRFDRRGQWMYDSTRQEHRLWLNMPHEPNHQGVIDYLVRLAQERRAS